MFLRTCCRDHVLELTQHTLNPKCYAGFLKQDELCVDKENKAEEAIVTCPACRCQFELADACSVALAKQKKKQRKAEEARSRAAEQKKLNSKPQHQTNLGKASLSYASPGQNGQNCIGSKSLTANLIAKNVTMRQLSLYVVTLVDYPEWLLSAMFTSDSQHKIPRMKLPFYAGSEREVRERIKKRLSTWEIERVVDGQLLILNSSPYIIHHISRIRTNKNTRNKFIVRRDWDGNSSGSRKPQLMKERK